MESSFRKGIFQRILQALSTSVRQETAQRGTPGLRNSAEAPRDAEISAWLCKPARGWWKTPSPRQPDRDGLVPQDDAQESVNRITPRHPQLVPFGEPGVSMGFPWGFHGISMGTPWNSSEGASSQLLHFQGRAKSPGEKTGCVFPLFPSAAAGQRGQRGGKAFPHCQGIILGKSSRVLPLQQPGLLLPACLRAASPLQDVIALSARGKCNSREP